MKNARVSSIPKGKGNGMGRARKAGPSAATRKYTNRARATSKNTSN